MKTKKWEIILFAVIFAAAAAGWLVVNHLKNSKDYGSVTITINGEEFGTYSLGEDQVIEIPTVDMNGAEHRNVCTIERGSALMTEADCPDGLCMYMPAIDAKGGYICCLPHGIFVMGNPSEEARKDGTALDSVG